MLEPLGNALEFDGRGIGREDRAGLELIFETGKNLVFDLEFFDHGFDDHIGPGHALAGRIGLEPQHGGIDLVALLEALLKQLFGAIQRGFDALHINVLQSHRHAAQSAPGGNVATHHARADDMHALELGALVALLFQRLGGEEHPAQINRGFAAHQWHEGIDLVADHGAPVIAMLLEQIDQRIGRGVVIELGFFAHFLAQFGDDKPA